MMGNKPGIKHKDRKRKTWRKEDSLEGSEDMSVVGILKKLQQQISFLERKVDRLTDILENKPVKEPYHSKFSREEKSTYRGSKERKFSRGDSKGADDRPGEQRKGKSSSFGKSFGKPFGKPPARRRVIKER